MKYAKAIVAFVLSIILSLSLVGCDEFLEELNNYDSEKSSDKTRPESNKPSSTKAQEKDEVTNDTISDTADNITSDTVNDTTDETGSNEEDESITDSSVPLEARFGGLVFELPSYFSQDLSSDKENSLKFTYLDGTSTSSLVFSTLSKSVSYSSFVMGKTGWRNQAISSIEDAKNIKLTQAKDCCVAGLASSLSSYSLTYSSISCNVSFIFINNTEENTLIMVSLITSGPQRDILSADFPGILSSALTTNQKDSGSQREYTYEFAFVRDATEYSMYYLIDEDTNTVRSFSTNDTGVLVGTYTGNLIDGIQISYYGGKMNETLTLISGSSESAYLTDSFGSKFTYNSTNVSDAEGYLSIEGFHDIDDI